MFWTACPAAPLTRLSMALTTTARRVAGSYFTPMSQKFVRCTRAQVGHLPGVVEPDERLALVAPLVDLEQISSAVESVDAAEVDRLQNAAVDRDQLRGEAEFALFEPRVQEHFRHVAVIEDRVGGEVLRHFAEAGLERRLAARAADAGFGVADDARGRSIRPAFDERRMARLAAVG